MGTPITTELVVFMLAVIGAVGGVWWRIESRFDARLQRLSKELADHKLHVATNHVSTLTLKETEERLITAIDKLASRMEAIVLRLDKMAGRE